MIEHDQIELSGHFTEIPLHQWHAEGRLAIGLEEWVGATKFGKPGAS
jgi:hypothetical protein